MANEGTERPGDGVEADRIRLINRIVGGRYELLEAVGEGPLLTAFRARDRQQNRIVALKTLHTSFASQATLVARLRSGFSETLSLSHPAIVRGYDVGEDGALCSLYYAEEFVRGMDLKERVRRAAPFQLNATVEIAIAVAEALEFAHGRGIPHGDLCPQNILIGPDSTVKVTGFGISGANALAASKDPTLLERMAAYTAPDLAANNIPTASADIYALCVLLYEMLTGDPPFKGDNPVQIALKHVQEPAPSPRTLNQAVPRALEGIVLKGLGKRPSERYPSAAAILADLRLVQEALRFGKSLSWSPQDNQPATVVRMAPVVAPTPVQTSVMPTAEDSSRRVSVVAAPSPTNMNESNSPTVTPPRRGGTGRIWIAVNLLLCLALIGACALVFTWIRPVLTPANVVTIPNLVGKKLDEAKRMASEQHFQIKVVEKKNMESPEEDVIYQMGEQPGQQVRQGREIPVWVSLGPEMAIVPSVTEMTLDKAQKLLERAGLHVGQLKYEYNEITPRGIVTEQDPRADGTERRKKGDKIALTISKGPEPIATPAPEPTLAPEPIRNTTGSEEDPEKNSDLSDDMKERFLKVSYKVPDDGQQHHIRIEVEDANGTMHVAYDNTHRAGQKIAPEVSGSGKPENIKIRLYDNDQLKAEGTGKQ